MGRAVDENGHIILDEEEKGMGEKTMVEMYEETLGRHTFGEVPPHRVRLMHTAINITQGDRQEEYGSFLKNMEVWAKLCTVYIVSKYRGQTLDELQFKLTAEDAAQLMVLNKIMRTMQPEASPKEDTFVDEACYAAMAGEAALVAQEEKDEERG